MAITWPNPIARKYDFTSSGWAAAYDQVDEELDQIIDQQNSLLTAAQAQELRITEVSDDLTTHIADNNIHAGGIMHATQGHLRCNEAGGLQKMDYTAASITTDDGTRIADVAVTGDLSVAGAGGLDTGSVAADTWYNMFLIYDVDNSTAAFLFSLSYDNPSMPTGYTEKMRLGWCKTNDHSRIRPMQVIENYFRLHDVVSTVTVVDAPLGELDLSGLTTATWTLKSLAPFLPSQLLYPTATIWVNFTSDGAWMGLRPPYETETSPESYAFLVGRHIGTDQSLTIVKETLVPIDDAKTFLVRADYAGGFNAGLGIDGWYDHTLKV